MLKELYLYIVIYKKVIVLKQIEFILEKLNDLLILNEEVERAYSKASKMVGDKDYKAFSKKRSLERAAFASVLRNEFSKLEGKSKNLMALKRRGQLVRLKYKNSLKIEKESGFLARIYDIEVFSIKNYDEFLTQMNLPLSLCKIVLKQRDQIEVALHAMERGEEIFVSYK